MSVWGKVIGGVAGFAAGGPLGALLGAVAGHAFDAMREGRGENGEARQVAFTIAVIALSAKMAKVDGRVSRDEINAFKQVFHVPPHEMQNVGRLFDQARKDASGFESYAEQIAELFQGEPAVLEELLDGLFHIAKADGALHPKEVAFLREVAHIFGLNPRDFERVRAAQMDPAVADPFQVLGVERSIANDDLKAAYRRLIRENHPDTLIAQGMPPEFVTLANEKMAKINAAYDRIRRERGLR